MITLTVAFGNLTYVVIVGEWSKVLEEMRGWALLEGVAWIRVQVAPVVG